MKKIKLMYYSRVTTQEADFFNNERVAKKVIRLLNDELIESSGQPLTFDFYYLDYEFKGEAHRWIDFTGATEQKDNPAFMHLLEGTAGHKDEPKGGNKNSRGRSKSSKGGLSNRY